LFYRPYLADYARQFLASTARTEGLAATTDLPGVVRTQLLSVMGDLSTVGKCALIAAYRGQRGDATPMGYGAFHRWISDGAGRRALLDTYPEPERLLRLVTTRHGATP
jgi:hypothetical protein